MKKRNVCFILLLVSILLFAGRFGYLELQEYRSIDLIESSRLKETSSEMLASVDEKEEENEIQGLQQKYDNMDIKAVLSIPDTEFSYPVVQTTDNDFYLTHNYKKEYDSYGAIYADYRSSFLDGDKVIIFGHSSSKIDTPFNFLENYYEEDYYKEHRYLTLKTENYVYQYEIFSVYVETNDFTYMNMNFDSSEAWYYHILGLKSKSFYSTDVELEMNDDILILQTCSKHPDYQKFSKKYLLIVSRRV